MLRDRILKIFIVTAAIGALIAGGFALKAPAESQLAEKDGLHVVTLEGSPHELGLQQGRLLKDQIQQVYKVYLNDLVYQEWVKQYAILKGQTKAYSNPPKAIAEFAKGNEPNIPREYIEEMKGLAEGAGLEYSEVLNMTAHVDYFAMLMCSTIVAAGQATPDGKLIEARNLDWASGKATELDPFTTVFIYKPDHGHKFVSILYPGIVGALTAVNDQKLTVELNFSMAKKNGKSGFPALLIVRHIAQNAATLDEAETILRDMPRIAGYNVMVTDGKTNKARLIEITSDKVGTSDLRADGTLITTNHFVTKELSGENVDSSRFSQLPSGERYARLDTLLKQYYGKIDPQIGMTMIHDDGVKVSGTVQTTIFKPAEGLIWVWARNHQPDHFVEFNVGELLGN
jgi:predicted choloylglycine hydrolase